MGRTRSPFRWIGPRRLTPPGVDFDALPPIDVVLLSHNHYDHFDAPTVRRIAKQFPGAKWLCPLGLGELLTSLGVRSIEERDWWQTVDGAGFTATCTPARHFSGRGFRDRGATLWCGWTIAADGVRVYFAGDTALHPEFAAIAERSGPFDLVMLPIGAYEPRWFMESVHMNPEDATEAYRAVTSQRRRAAALFGAALGDVSSHRRTRRGTAIAVCAAMERGRVSASRELDARDRRDEAPLTAHARCSLERQSFIGATRGNRTSAGGPRRGSERVAAKQLPQ